MKTNANGYISYTFASANRHTHIWEMSWHYDSVAANLQLEAMHATAATPITIISATKRWQKIHIIRTSNSNGNEFVECEWKKKHTQHVRKLSYEMLNEKYGEKTARNRSVYYCDAAVAVLSEWRYSLFSAFHFPCYSVFYMNENKINIICITIRRALASCYARTIIIIIRLVHARCISIHRTQNGRDVAVTRIPHKRKCQ